MPRIRIADEQPRLKSGDLVTRLADELQSHRETGQPTIYEQDFGVRKIRVTVIWDEWDRLTLEDRTAVILRAYADTEGSECRERIALASGLTVPEAEAAGMLRFQIIAALRKDDSVTTEECRQAMIDVGASTLLDPEMPQFRFATREEAEIALNELVKRLPQSEPVWVITQEAGKVNDWIEG